MEYREFGKTGMKPSILGFGMMRLPKNEDGTINEQWAIETLRGAIDNGLTYVDTAYAYKDSERVTGLCLQDGYREKVTLATKLPVWMVNEEADFERVLNEELERLQTDHIDVYLLHALNRERWEHIQKTGIISFAEKAKAEGKIRHIGFSFHDSLDVFKDILYGYDGWEFCQLQLNYMDVNYQAGMEGLRLAHEKGLAVVIMEPLRGGTLANVSEDVAAMLPKNPVQSALEFLWNMPEVNVVLSGMNETCQVEQNMAIASNAHAGMLSQEELDKILAAGEVLCKKVLIPCTSCDYCNVCPQQIPIPKIFKIFNHFQSVGTWFHAVKDYKELGEPNGAQCVSCGLCVEQCPQHIQIFEQLAKIHERLT